MSEIVITYICTSGVTDAGWTNDTNAWDTTSGTYAYTVGNEYNNDYEIIYGYTTATGAGTITKVEVGLDGYKNTYFYYAYLWVSFSGARWMEGMDLRVPLTTTWDTYWFDVTSGTGSPPTFENREWTNDDITYANLGIYAKIRTPFSKLSTNRCYIDQLYWRVTYSG
jgi:hypothetical protein